MKKNILKFYFKMTFILLTTSAFSHQNLEERLKAIEEEISQISTTYNHQVVGAHFATARPQLTASNWWICVGLLYWQPKLGGTAYAITSDSADAFYGHPKYRENRFNWNQGFKGMLGYKTSHDDLDLLIRYTGYQSSSSSESNTNTFHTIIPLKLRFDFSNSSDRITLARSIGYLCYHTVDLEISRNLFLSEKFSIKPYLSLKGTSIALKQNVTYTTTKPFTFETSLNSVLQGIGSRFGVDHRFFLSNRISFYGDLATAILYGYFHNRETTPSFPQGENNQTQFIKDRFQQIVYFSQIGMGLEWNKPMHQQRQYLHFKIGYEMQSYSKANPMERFTPFAVTQSRNLRKASIKDLIFYGINMEMRFDF